MCFGYHRRCMGGRGARGDKCSLNISSAYEYFFWLLSWRGTNKKYWVESGGEGGKGCMYVRDWFKPIFPLFLTSVLIPMVDFAHPARCYYPSYTYGGLHRRGFVLYFRVPFSLAHNSALHAGLTLSEITQRMFQTNSTVARMSQAETYRQRGTVSCDGRTDGDTASARTALCVRACACTPSLGPTHPPTRLLPWALSQDVKRPECKGESWPVTFFNADVKNNWSCTATPSYMGTILTVCFCVSMSLHITPPNAAAANFYFGTTELCASGLTGCGPYRHQLLIILRQRVPHTSCCLFCFQDYIFVLGIVRSTSYVFVNTRIILFLPVNSFLEILPQPGAAPFRTERHTILWMNGLPSLALTTQYVNLWMSATATRHRTHTGRDVFRLCAVWSVWWHRAVWRL
jgi:hypothetical protein